MDEIHAWPLASRSDIVMAYRRDSDPDAEAPYRTLRRHSQVSAGRPVYAHDETGFDGRFTFFCSLNVDAARLARRGHGDSAQALAIAAAEIESSPEFVQLITQMTNLPREAAAAIQSGSWFTAGPELWQLLPSQDVGAITNRITDLLIMITNRTARARSHLPALAELEDVIAGTVAEADSDEITVRAAGEGRRYRVPRWLAESAGRTARGNPIVLITERSGTYLSCAAVPGIAIPGDSQFDPFAREANGVFLGEDEHLLDDSTGHARVLVPMRS
jgi:hypothetical protein